MLVGPPYKAHSCFAPQIGGIDHLFCLLDCLCFPSVDTVLLS